MEENLIILRRCLPYAGFSKHRPSGPMLSISRNVRLSVHLSVRVPVCSLLRYRLTGFWPPLPEVGCPIFSEIRNPWGKVMERRSMIVYSWSTLLCYRCYCPHRTRDALSRVFGIFSLFLHHSLWYNENSQLIFQKKAKSVKIYSNLAGLGGFSLVEVLHRLGVAGAVQQRPLLLIKSVILFLQTLKTSLHPSHKS